MTSGLLSAELAATCNAIGFYDGMKYHLEPHSKETIKDIIRYLRRDEDSHDIRRFLGNSKIFKTDLLPILQCHSKDKDLFDLILRLIVNLSTPVLIVYNEVIPTDKSELNQYSQIVSHLQCYKEAFTSHQPWSVLSERLSTLLSKDVEFRDEDDQRTIERILILVRNVLHVPSDALTEGRPDNDASLHDQVIWALHQSSMLDLLLYMASSSQESTFFMHLLEIICLMVREQPPSLLAKTAAQRSFEEKHRDEEELLKLRQKEQQLRQNKQRQYLGARHSNFGGTFVIKNMKSITENDLIYHKPLHQVDNFSLDVEKKKVKIPKNRQPLKCSNVERRSALSVRLILKQLCVEILNAAYNPLMRYIKDCLSRGKTQDNDESYYFTAMKFFMEFNRHYKFQVKLVSETMSVESFHFTQKFLETWHEMMITDKKKIALWSARMHLALKAYKELLQNLAMMDSSTDAGVRESSKVIKSNIFYVIEYREMLLVLINTYKKSKYSHQYLIDLIETAHIFLKLLDKFCQNKKVVVQETRKRHNKGKSKKKKQPEGKILAAEELWPQIQESLEKVLSSPVSKEVIPFDAASEKNIEEQKVDAMKRIQVLLKSGDSEEAVALLRSSREVWPENDCFGHQNMSHEEELNSLKDVFLADLEIPGYLQNKENLIEETDNEEDEEEETIYPTLAEKTFDIMDLVKRFASPKVVGICITLLNTFDKNTPFTNHCVAKMLHRIAWDCKLPSMLFQASLFKKFQLILQSKDPLFKELAGLAIFVIRKFVQIAETNKKVFMELLFFKHANAAYEIECGYGSFQQKPKPSKQNWEEHEEEELRRLHEEYLQTMPSQDMVQWVSEHLINERSERIVKKKMKELGLNLLKKNKKGLAISWSEEQEEELKDLYKSLMDSGGDVIQKILEKLNISRSRQNVAKALVRLGFAESTKEFSRKPVKSGTRKGKGDSSSSSEENESSDEEEGTVQETREQIRAKESIPDLYHTTELIFMEKEVNSYLIEGLKWLNSCMEDCIEDLDDDPTEVPLLPLSSEALLSVENPEFKLFLSSLGIFRPLQQEIYWRFPADWNEANFKSREKLISLITENESIEDHKEELYSLIKEITGKEPASNVAEESKDTSSQKSSPVIKKETQKTKNKPKNKLNELKKKLLGGDESGPVPKNKLSKENKKLSKTTKEWTAEEMEEASTEDFNAIVAEQCRQLLDKEGVVVNSQEKSPIKTTIEDSENENIKKPESSQLNDSDTEEATKKNSGGKIFRLKKSRIIDSDSEDGNTDSEDDKLNKNTEASFSNQENSNTIKSDNSSKRFRLLESDSDDDMANKNTGASFSDKEYSNTAKSNKFGKRLRLLESDSEDEPSLGTVDDRIQDLKSLGNSDDDGSNSTLVDAKKNPKTINRSQLIDSEDDENIDTSLSNFPEVKGDSLSGKTNSEDQEASKTKSIFPPSKRSRQSDSEDERTDNFELKIKKKRHVIESDEDSTAEIG